VSETHLTPYFHFADEAREAMTFYRGVFGGELTVQTFAELGMSGAAANDDRVMHAQLEASGGLVLMASDVPDGVPHQPGSSISVSLSGDDEATLTGYFDGLAAGGTVVEPLVEAPWGDRFGMCVDRFGTSWMVNISAPAA
jgi:PhnB protein